MSNVGKAGPTAVASPDAGRPEAGERATNAGTFERVLQDKGRGERTEGRERVTERPSSGIEKRPTRGSASASTGAPERDKGEPRDWRALPGDVAVPSRAPAGPLPVVESSRAADAVARVARIAEQIVRAVEVRLGPAGTAEVRLELDLGGLDRVRVVLHRDAEGKVAVRFDGAGAEASRLIGDRGQELAGRLEARGIALREVAMTGADGTLVRIGSPSEPGTAELVSRLAEDAARRREQASWRQDDRERRGRRTPRPVDEEKGE